MLIIQHRINTVEALRHVPKEFGVELDVRSEGKRLILSHDPFCPGEDFETYLKHYRHVFMIVNMKSEGLEEAVLDLLESHGIRDFFLLDLSAPAMVRLAKKKENRFAVRFSEYEPLAHALAFSGLASWVWVDCFHTLTLTEEAYTRLSEHFKLCLVSPELENHPPERIQEFQRQLSRYPLDAVCTKHPEQWQA